MAEVSSGISTQDPGGPPLDLPIWEGTQPRNRTKIDISVPRADPFAGAPTWSEKPSPPSVAGSQTDPFAGAQTWSEQPQQKQEPISTADVAGHGILHGFSFGLTPAISGLAEAAGPEWTQKETYGESGNPVAPIVGAVKMLHNYLSDHPDPKISEAYEKGRSSAADFEKRAQTEHPAAWWTGVVSGSLLGPGFGAAKAGTALERTMTGMGAGFAGGGAYGAGSAIGEGQPTPEVVKRGLLSGTIGAGIGGPLSAAVGPRVAAAATTPGQKAAEAAADIGAPIPRGLASDSRLVQGTTAKLRSVPFVGSAIGNRLAATQEAAGERLGEIATQASGGATKLSDAIAGNKAQANALYGRVRGLIDENAQFTMPQTRQAVDEVIARRTAAHHPNPRQGLEQFDRAANGSTFSGAHRARSDARDAGDVLNPHPGYNAGDFNKITAAMTTDLRDMAGAAAAQKAGGSPARQARAADAAMRAFDKAESEFGRIAERNKVLSKLEKSRGDGGNVLYNLGFNDSTGEFSLNKFVTGWSKMPESQKKALFDPTHISEINELFGLGRHVKGALAESNTSHTGSIVVLLDIAKDAALLGADLAQHGTLGTGTMVGLGSTAAMILLGRWLASPAKMRAIGAWSRAYQAVKSGAVSPARMSAFNAATRNLSSNLGVPAERILRTLYTHATGNADVPDQNK